MSIPNQPRKIKKPWPTKEAMEQVYEMNLWGGVDYDFYSGEGSHQPKIIKPYINVVSEFLNSFKVPLTLCDLGCGDFNVGKNLVPYCKKYIAIDIVENLIDYNKKQFQVENLVFKCLDIAVDDLPIADCVIVRQVLQHLSNKEVERVIKKLYNYKYVILTEHIPMGNFVPNKDIISGQGIRIKKQSGLNILAAPFCFKVKNTKELTSIVLNDNKGVIVTTLYTVF
ncbi:methyltransferase [Wenyingzhuangia sp. IMCC45467]